MGVTLKGLALDHGQPTRDILQVWSRKYRSDVVYIALHGPCVCLNAEDLAPSGYRLQPVTRTVSDDSTLTVQEMASSAPLNPRKPNSPESVIASIVRDVTEYRKRHGSTEMMNHLVINCHGFTAPDETGLYRAFMRLGHDWDYWRGHDRPKTGQGMPYKWNIGFSHHNIEAFSALKGMFRYIWVQGCSIGAESNSEATLGNKLADVTGAIVSVMAGSTVVRRCEPGWIDYPHMSFTRVYAPGRKETMSPDEHFCNARRTQSPNLNESLYFNVVKDGRL